MFRGAVRGDLPQILQIYAHAREAMAASGNPTQWGNNFPPQELLEEDIDSNRLFVYVVNGQLLGVFAFILGVDPTYQVIEDGAWLNDNQIMQHLLEKNGFTRCGIIHVADGTPRIAYQKLALTQQHS